MEDLANQSQRLNVTKSQADAAEEELVKLFNRPNVLAKLATAARVHALVCSSLLKHGASAAAAAAAAGRLSTPNNAPGCFASLPAEQDAVLSAVARLLHGDGLAAQAATHLLLTLAGQGLDASFELQAEGPADLQRIMSNQGILRGLVQQLARGSGSAPAAAALLLARSSASGGSAVVATQLIKNHAALSKVTALLQWQGSKASLADAAAQLLHAVAAAGLEAAQVVAETDGAVAGLLSLLLNCSRVSQQPDSVAITAAARAARALCSIMRAAGTSVRWRVANDGGVVAALAPTLQNAYNAFLREQALDVLLAAASKGEADMCSLISSCSTLAYGLSRMLPGGTAPLQAAQDLAITLAANSPSNSGAQFTVRLMQAATRMPPYGSKAVVQQHAVAAAEQTVWVLTHLQWPGGRQQLLDAMAPLLPAPGAGSAILSVLRVAVASNLGALLAQAPNGSTEVQEVIVTALSMLVQSASAEERAKMASSADVVRGLAHYLQLSNQHGSGDTFTCASSWGVGAAPAGAALLQLAGDSKLQPAALIVPAPASTQASSEASLQSWLTDNSEVLQQAAASGWGSLSVTQLAAVAQQAKQAQAQQQQQLQQHLSSVHHSKHTSKDQKKKHKKRQGRCLEQGLCSSAADGAAAAAGAGMSGADASDISKKQRRQRAPSELPALQPLPADHTKQVQRHEAAAGKALLARQSHDTSSDSADQSSPAASAAARRSRRRAGQAAVSGQTSRSSSAAFASLSPTMQQLIIDGCGSIPPDQHLAAWQVAAQPFHSQQLEDLCATYMRCNFAFGESWGPEVRSHKLVPMLQQLHTQAKAEQQSQARQASTTTAAQPTPATMKLLRMLRLLQHWDIVCPTQPGMPEPLRKMMQQAGCAAAGSACDSDDDDDVQVVDTEIAAEVDDDVEAQLQQLEDGDCDMVLVKYVPGRHEQPDVQLVDQPPPALQQEATAVPLAAPMQRPGQQPRQQQPNQVAVQPAAQPVVAEELPLRMRTRAAKRGRPE